jgi:hypothetical protein
VSCPSRLLYSVYTGRESQCNISYNYIVDATVRLMQVVLASEHLSPSPSRTLRPAFVQDFFFFSFLWDMRALCGSICSSRYDVRTTHFSTATTTSASTSALRGYHLHMVFIGFYSSHSIRAIITLQLRGMSSDSTFGLFSNLTMCGAHAVTWGSNLFGKLYVLYNRLSYISGYI